MWGTKLWPFFGIFFEEKRRKSGFRPCFQQLTFDPFFHKKPAGATTRPIGRLMMTATKHDKFDRKRPLPQLAGFGDGRQRLKSSLLFNQNGPQSASAGSDQASHNAQKLQLFDPKYQGRDSDLAPTTQIQPFLSSKTNCGPVAGQLRASCEAPGIATRHRLKSSLLFNQNGPCLRLRYIQRSLTQRSKARYSWPGSSPCRGA